ncbi:putative adhesin [Cryptosporangium sp. NPDC051539]|uniref:putative adhesin n=1 Tax=Cryptosporangium sp. NPDC051539 TaxID=3363962 RepID=UPI0037BCF0A5
MFDPNAAKLSKSMKRTKAVKAPKVTSTSQLTKPKPKPKVQAPPPATLVPPQTPPTAAFGHVVSGHGTFVESNLNPLPGKRVKDPKFDIPANVTLVFYAPQGAYLDNQVGNRIEAENPPTQAELILERLGTKTLRDLPGPYPYSFGSNRQDPEKRAVDYTVRPPGNLSVGPSAYTVTQSTALHELLSLLPVPAVGGTTVHYACCGSGTGASEIWKGSLPWAGWYVRLRTATDPAHGMNPP